MSTKITNEIVAELQMKAALKAQILKIGEESFQLLETALNAIAEEYNALLENGVKVELIKRSPRVFQINADEDTLIFSLQTNVFQFDREHEAWQTEYVEANPLRSYATIVNIYNFLSDSFKYDRDEDLGYLVARVFVNAEGSFFVEGKRQRGMGHKDFGKKVISAQIWRKIAETALRYCIEFDLLAQPYDNVKITDLAHMNLEIMSSKTKTGKRLGFQFNSDDVKDN
ncbi:MAG: hypothetical protein MJZ01_06540 [Bacteroidales bacterium]|nr:hypothetical protein [Bacteroidales bacterium]